MTLEDFVFQTLRSTNVDHLNFQFGRMRVYPSGYRRDILGCFQNGRIRLSLGHLDGSAAASFSVDTQRGQVHQFTVSNRYVEERQPGELHMRTLSVTEQADFRGTIIHECTHALQDWQQIPLDPRTAEGAAYLAGAITRRLWGYSYPVVNRNISGTAYSLWLADQFLAASIHDRYIINEDDVRQLCSRVMTGSAHRYVFNGI